MTINEALRLEKSGKCLFHGSSRKLKLLKPQQQMTYSYKKHRLVKDGKAAVCVTPFLKVAVFRSLVNKDFNGFGITNGRISLRASKKALALARKAYGFIYVVPKTNFRKHSTMEWRISHSVQPIGVFKTSFNDLPKGIRIIKDWDNWRRRFYGNHKTAPSAVLSSTTKTW